MTTVLNARPDAEYEDIVFALRAVERSEARRIRERAGLTRATLADRVGVSEMTVRRWELGENLPGLVSGLDTAVAYGRELRRLERREA